MSERPFMQLYVSDFIGDTLHLSAEQIGAYMLLLMAMWNAGGELPDDDAKLARIARMSIKKWRSDAVDLRGFFEARDGVIFHNRLTKELQKSERKSQSRSAAGAEGGRAKALKDKEARLANATSKPQHSPDTRSQNISDANASSSPEPGKPAPVAVIGLPTVSDGDFQIAEDDVAEWIEAFPAVDVRQQLSAMRQWLIANPSRRKTRRGMRKFVVSWLDRRQNAGPAPQLARQSTAPPSDRGRMNATLDRLISGEPDEPDPRELRTIDASYERTDRRGVESVVQFPAVSARY